MKCHITSTLGPACQVPGVLEKLIEKSDRLRINTSFTTPKELSAWLEVIDSFAEKCGKQTPVVLDLQGAKMRIGHYPQRVLESGRYTLVLGQKSTDLSEIPVPHSRLFQALAPGDRLSFNDNRVQARVLSVEPSKAAIKIEKGGPLSSFKGINRVDHPVAFSGLEERDKQLIQAAGDRPALELSYSFVLDGEEAGVLRELSSARYIAKIERPESMKHLDKITRSFDELWLCRGDMGAQAGLSHLGPLQQGFVEQLKGTDLPLILAGQVLEYMSHFPEPTRAEVVQLYNALAAGFTGIVLSDESAVGKNPIAVLDFLSQVKMW